MSVMDIFRTALPSSPAQNAPPGANPNNPNPGLPGTQQSQGTDGNGLVPAGSGDTPDNKQVSPGDEFKDLWKTDPNAPKEETPGSMFANIDPAKLMESARRVDFTKTIKPEQLQAIAKGGEDAIKAFSESLNNVAQTVYAQSAIATTKIVENALTKAQEGYDSRLPSMIKKHSTNERVSESNSTYNDPAFAPIVSALTEQFQRKNPNASSSEITDQVKGYMEHMGEKFAPKPKETPASKKQKAASTEDWSKFLEDGS